VFGTPLGKRRVSKTCHLTHSNTYVLFQLLDIYGHNDHIDLIALSDRAKPIRLENL